MKRVDRFHLVIAGLVIAGLVTASSWVLAVQQIVAPTPPTLKTTIIGCIFLALLIERLISEIRERRLGELRGEDEFGTPGRADGF